MGYVLDGCCCGGGPCCCGCWPNQYGYCDTPGNLPTTLHISITTSCGTFTAPLTFLSDGHEGFWWCTINILCKQIIGYDGINPIYQCKSLPFDFCLALGCGSSAFQAGCQTWNLELVCTQGCGQEIQNLQLPPGVFQTADAYACSPFYAHWLDFHAILNCEAQCQDATCEVVITE